MGETRLFVGNVPADATEQELKSEFGFYGVVNKVELKLKNEIEHFAFVNIVIEERLVEKCIREFGQQQFKGSFLSVARAKESFLDRLKREREEAENAKRAPAEQSSHQEDESLYHRNFAPLPKIEKEVEVSSDESSSEEEMVAPKPPVRRVQPAIRPPVDNYYSRNSYDDSYQLTKAEIDDQKRHESLLKLKSLHDQQKKAIQSALSSIDTAPRNNKIVFEPPEPPTPRDTEEDSRPQANNKRKAQLFDEGEEDGDEETPKSFKVKKQFEGKKGEKLFELQNRFHDKRFEIDERFADDPEDSFDARKKYTREELKERKKLRKEMENWDQNELKEERDNQLSILEGITGQSAGGMSSKPGQKGMLRFDPSKKEHLKYLDLVGGDEAATELNDRAGDNRAGAENFEVSDEKFYKVSENLAQSLQKSESKPFSIFEMLGVRHDDEEEADVKSEEEQPKILSKIPTFHVNQVKFRYDSSDTDEEAEKTKAPKKKRIVQMKAKGGKYSKSGVWRHNFFLADGDERLKEAFAFLKTPETTTPEAFDEKRNQLRQVIKSRIRKAKSDRQKQFGKNKIPKKRKV